MTRPAENTHSKRSKRLRLSPEVRREALLEAAKACLGKEGLKGFSLQNVAAEAKVSNGLIGHYFGGLNELLTAVFHSVMSDVPEFRPGRPGGIEEALEDLRQMIAQNFSARYYSRENLRIWLPIYEEMMSNRDIRSTLNKADEAHIRKVAAFIARVAELRGLTINVRNVAYNFLALLDGLWIRWCHSSRKDTAYEQAAACDYLESILGPIRR